VADGQRMNFDIRVMEGSNRALATKRRQISEAADSAVSRNGTSEIFFAGDW